MQRVLVGINVDPKGAVTSSYLVTSSGIREVDRAIIAWANEIKLVPTGQAHSGMLPITLDAGL
jgi:TonB family protein